MDFTTETVASREVEFTVHPPAEQVAEAMRRAAREASKRVRVPGFRPGKAPYALVERTVGKEHLTEEAAESLANDIYPQILEEGGYQPYSRPALRVVQLEPLELKIRVALQPTVELPDYCAMKVEPEPEPQVTPEQIEEALNELREQHGTWEPVERAAQIGDQIILDIKGAADGEPVFDEHETQLTLTESLSPPGFAEALVGMEPAQIREFSLTYPATYAQEALAGKTVAFTVTLRGLKERRLPEADDEFAKSVGDYASLDDLKARLQEGLKARLDAEARSRLAMRTLDQVVEQSKLEYPNLAVENEIDAMVDQRESRLRQQGFTLENYLRLVHKSMAQMRDELRTEAEAAVRRTLVLRQVAKAENIEVKPEDVVAAAERYAGAYGEQADAVFRALLQQDQAISLASDLYVQKALDRLVDVVTGKAQGVCAPPEPEAEAPAGGEAAPSEPAAG